MPKLVQSVLLPIVIGLVGFVTLASKPRFADIRTVDVLQLTGSGMCFGVALVAFVIWLRGGPPSS